MLTLKPLAAALMLILFPYCEKSLKRALCALCEMLTLKPLAVALMLSHHPLLTL